MSNVNDMTRDSFVFYRSFRDCVAHLSDEERLTMYEAIFDFALDMQEPSLTGNPKGFFIIMRPLLEANIRRWRNGYKGGAPLGSSNNPNGRRGNKAGTNQELTKNKANENVNVDVEYNKRESKKEKNKVSPSPTCTAHEDCDEGLRAWFEKGNAPFIYNNMEHLVSSEELAKLKEEYDADIISDTILAIENRSDLRENYKNLYATLKNWLRKGKEAHHG